MSALIIGIRIRFTKEEPVKYMSHLDTLKMFERALRRAAIHITHSQGFNPHAHMVFGLPLQVGVTSEAEYADFEFGEGSKLTPDDFVENLNQVMPEGIRITGGAAMRTRANIMSCVTMAAMNVTVKTEAADFMPKVDGFIAQKEIQVERRTKNGTRTVDIRPMIDSIECADIGKSRYILEMKLDAGSVSNLKPDAVVEGLRIFTGSPVEISSIHRTALFVKKNDRIMDPMSVEALTDE